MSAYVIEPATASRVIHTIRADSSLRGKAGNWYASCGAVVPGLILEADIVDGTPCRKCEARAAKFNRHKK